MDGKSLQKNCFVFLPFSEITTNTSSACLMFSDMAGAFIDMAVLHSIARAKVHNVCFVFVLFFFRVHTRVVANKPQLRSWPYSFQFLPCFPCHSHGVLSLGHSTTRSSAPLPSYPN